MTITSDELLNVVEQIYAVPMQQDGWKPALRSISQLFGAVASTFSGTYANERVFRPTFVLHDTENEEAMQEYTAYYHQLCERARFSHKEAVGSVYYDLKYFSEHQMNRNEYYNFAARHGGKYAMGTTLARPDKALGIDGTQQCAVHFSAAQGHPDHHVIKAFERLVPHIMRANQVQQKLNRKRSSVSGLTAVIDALPEAVVGLDEKAGICFANRQAEQIFQLCDGIQTTGMKLGFTNSEDQRAFAKALGDLGSADGLLSASNLSTLTIKRPSGSRPFILYIAPTSLSPERLPAEISTDRLKYIVIISEPEAQLHISTDDLGRIFELTPRESDLAMALANGLSLRAYCQMNGISAETARWHLGNVFSKTATHRQIDLVRLICNMAVPRC